MWANYFSCWEKIWTSVLTICKKCFTLQGPLNTRTNTHTVAHMLTKHTHTHLPCGLGDVMFVCGVGGSWLKIKGSHCQRWFRLFKDGQKQNIPSASLQPRDKELLKLPWPWAPEGPGGPRPPDWQARADLLSESTWGQRKNNILLAANIKKILPPSLFL